MDKLLKIENLSKHFGGVKAVNDFNLSLEQGNIYGLIGPNGAGKTTVFNVITGIYKPTAGSVVFMGKDITGYQSHAVAQAGIGRTFQNIRLFSNLSVLDNVILASNRKITYSMLGALFRTPKYRREEKEVRENGMVLLETVGIQNYANHKANSLPYGHQRKLEIARALALEPKLLLLDEPAAGMTTQESQELVQFIINIREKFDLTILMIEHHMDVVSGLCNDCTVLNFGETIASGSAVEVKIDPVVIEAYLGEEE